MSDENKAETLDSAQSEDKQSGKRQRSSIAFPYLDLDEAIAIARGIYANVGSGKCSADQLGPWLKQSPSSSAFKMRIGVARLFGLIEGEYGALRLSDLGRKIIDPKVEAQARVSAFLNVPLYRAVYEKIKGGVVPPSAAFERELVALGVADTQKDRARQVLERSAEQAGFHREGRNRLVMPGFAPPDGAEITDNKSSGTGAGNGGNGSGGGGDDSSDLPRHPLIEGLFKVLPPDGQSWTLEDAGEWLQAAASNLRFAYKFKGSIKIEIVPPKSPPPE